MTQSGVERALDALLSDPALFSRWALCRPLRSYQAEAARAIVESVVNRRGLGISLMFSRQAGKNETSAQVEAFLLTRYQRVPGAQIVKAAPTFRPQIVNSLIRLRRCLNNPLSRRRWRDEAGYIVRLGEARALFFSAGPSAQVVGATASLALEVDEAQDVLPEKHDKDFMPMAATTNATRVYYGTAWTEDTLLARIVEEHRRQERRDGVRRHFRVPWWVVAEQVPEYGRFVEAERSRLGESHPLFKTQYCLETIAGGGRFFSPAQLALMIGDHARSRRPPDEAEYVAGVDVAGEDEQAEDAALRSLKPRKDSTVVTIARLQYEDVVDGLLEPRLEVVDHHWWTGRDHRTQFGGLLSLLRDAWRVSRVCVDSTGVGAGVASFLCSALGESICEPVHFTAARKSELGYGLLAAVNSGRFRVYREVEQSEEAREWWWEAERCRYEVGASQLIRWHVPEDEGHDDYVTSAALCVAAASGRGIAPAGAELRARPAYRDERW